MRISIFGLGYVGTVSAAVLADQGNDVIGVDVNQDKVNLINKGKSPIIEKDVPEILDKAVKSNRLRATTDDAEAVSSSDVSVVCVGTPSDRTGAAYLGHIKNVMSNISSALENKIDRHLVVLRSTVPPGTMENLVIPQFTGNDKVSFCYNPEFLREGSSVQDYYNPPYTVVACSDKFALESMREYYSPVDAEFINVDDYKIAESMKMVNNVFHALKTVFANEIKRFGEANDVDPGKIMELVCKDTKLNISAKYLRPGFAIGGSCLPKDIRSLSHLCKQSEIEVPMIDSLLKSNEDHITDAINKVESHGKRNLGFIGLSFKQGTDDLRESPYVRLAEYFYGKGYDLAIYDPKVMTAELTGSNKGYIQEHIPHLVTLLKGLDEVMEKDVILLNHNVDISRYNKQRVVDLR